MGLLIINDIEVIRKTIKLKTIKPTKEAISIILLILWFKLLKTLVKKENPPKKAIIIDANIPKTDTNCKFRLYMI